MGDSYFDSKFPQSISCVKKMNPNIFKRVSNKIIQTPSTFSFTNVYLEKKKNMSNTLPRVHTNFLNPKIIFLFRILARDHWWNKKKQLLIDVLESKTGIVNLSGCQVRRAKDLRGPGEMVQSGLFFKCNLMVCSVSGKTNTLKQSIIQPLNHLQPIKAGRESDFYESPQWDF